MLQQWLLIDYVENVIYLYTKHTEQPHFCSTELPPASHSISSARAQNAPLLILWTENLPPPPQCFPLLPWSCRVGITGEDTLLNVIPSAQTTSLGCISNHHLLYLFIPLMPLTSERSYHMTVMTQ